MKLYLIVFMLVLFNFGCVNTQIGTEPVTVNELANIRDGFSTKSDVRLWFGDPLRKAPGPEGEIWVYRYIANETGSTPQELTVSFNGSVVSSHSYH